MQRAIFLSLALCLSAAVAWTAQDTPEPPQSSQPRAPAGIATEPHSRTSAQREELDFLGDAIRSYWKGDFDHAIQSYEQVLRLRPNSPDAHAGLTRVYLKKKDVARAYETVIKGLQATDSPTVRVALGEVYFRQGHIAEAEQEWVKVINSGFLNPRAYMGLARVNWALSNYKRGWMMIDKAHELDPTDPDITRLWVGKLSRADRIKFWEEYLAGETNDDAETLESLRQYLEYLKARAKDSRGACHLVSQITATETKLIPIRVDPKRVQAYGLAVAVNGKKSELELDTGASGILINSKLAEKAVVTDLSESEVRGIGDRGSKGGRMGLANSLKIGELEFQNCSVRVLDQRSVLGHDGLIGMDIFAAFLVDVDFPNEKLRLTQLPTRPGENAPDITLQADRGEVSASEDEPADKNAEPINATNARPHHLGPQDSYVAPGMQSYTKFYRFGHTMLLSTLIGDAPVKLFLLDTGSTNNLISPSAAEEVTRVHGDARILQGLNGSVKNVYRADKAIIQFAHMRQENQGLLAIDMSHMSDRIGTEVSGVLGFEVLRLLDMKIDYRDGLVSFSLDPRRRYF